jgi:hypothetical protein
LAEGNLRRRSRGGTPCREVRDSTAKPPGIPHIHRLSVCLPAQRTQKHATNRAITAFAMRQSSSRRAEQCSTLWHSRVPLRSIKTRSDAGPASGTDVGAFAASGTARS